MDYCYSVEDNDLCSEKCAELLLESLREFDRFRKGQPFALDLYTDYRTAGLCSGAEKCRI